MCFARLELARSQEYRVRHNEVERQRVTGYRQEDNHAWDCDEAVYSCWQHSATEWEMRVYSINLDRFKANAAYLNVKLERVTRIGRSAMGRAFFFHKLTPATLQGMALADRPNPQSRWL